MKFVGSFVLLAIAAFFNYATAFEGLSLHMSGNASMPSALVATFKDYSERSLKKQILKFDIYIQTEEASQRWDFLDMKCFVELDMAGSFDRLERTLSVPVVRYQTSKDHIIGFEANVSVTHQKYLGQFRLACSYTPTGTFERDFQAIVYASIDYEKNFVTTKGFIASLSSFATDYSVFIAEEQNSDRPSTFTLRGPTSDRFEKGGFVVVGRGPHAVTSGTEINMAGREKNSACDAYWDGELRPNSVSAFVMSGGSIMITYHLKIENVNTIVAHCPEVHGEKLAPYLPAIVEIFLPRGEPHQKNYAIVETPEF